MTKSRQKITYIVLVLLAMLIGRLHAAQPNNTKKDRNYKNKELVALLVCGKIGLQIVHYIGCKGTDGYKALSLSAGLGHLGGVTYLIVVIQKKMD